MFNGSGFYMGGMHGMWWIFWLVLIGVFLIFGWARPSTLKIVRRSDPTAVSVKSTPVRDVSDSTIG